MFKYVLSLQKTRLFVLNPAVWLVVNLGLRRLALIANRHARAAIANTPVVPQLEDAHIPDTFARAFLPSANGDRRGVRVHSIRANPGVRDHNNDAVGRS